MANRINTNSTSARLLLRTASALLLAIAFSVFFAASSSFSVLYSFASAAITTNPTNLVAQMPFYVISGDTTVTSLFIATSSSCSSTSMLGNAQVISAPMYSALFNFPTRTDTMLYVCRFANAPPMSTLSFTLMTYTPQYFIRNVQQTLRFSDNVPTGSTFVSIREFSQCTGTEAFGQFVSPSQTVSATTDRTFFYFVCVRVLSPATNQEVTVNIGAIVSTDRATVLPSSALKNQINTQFEVGGSAPPNTRVIIAPNAECSQILQGPVAVGGQYGKSFALTVGVDRGTYMFCTENPLSSGIFVPSDTPLTVEAYTVTPITIFANTAVTFTFGGDIPSSFRLGWSTSGCENPTWMKSIKTINGPSVTETFALSTGSPSYVVSSCVYQVSGTAPAVLVANHTVVEPYSATLNRGANDVVRGLSLSVTVSPHPATFVSLHMGTGCNGVVFASGTSSNYVFSTLVPLSLTFPGPMTVCLKTIDGSAVYAVRTANVRNFVLNYGVAILNKPTLFEIDGALAVGALVTPLYKFVVGNMVCSGVDAGFGERSPTPTANLTFTSVDSFTFCARSYSLDFVPITVVQTFASPTISPNATLTGITTVVDVYGVPVGLTAIIGRACNMTAADQVQIRSGAMATVQFTVNYAEGGLRLICVFLPSANGTTSPYVAGTLTISTVSVTPTRAFQGQMTRFNIITSLFPPTLLQGSSAFITTTGPMGCASAPADTPTAVVYNNGYPYVNLQAPAATGTIGVCVGGNTATTGAYLFGGSVSVIPGLITTFTPAIPVVNIPFSMSFNGAFTPANFVIATEANGCEVPTISGPLVGGATTSPITINTAGMYVICVEADPGTYLVAANLNMKALSASPATYVRTTSTQLGTSPALPTDTTTLFLTSAVDCTGPRWFASETSPLAAPVGVYVLCAIIQASGGGTVTAISSNRVNVIDAYQLALPTGRIRSFIPFTIGLSGGDVAAAGFAAVFFIPKTSPTTGLELNCHTTAQTSTEIVSRYNSTTPWSMSVMINGREDLPYKLCVWTRDASTAVQLTTITPASYVTPAVVIKGITSTLTSGYMSNGYGILAQNSDCSGTRYAGPTQIANYLMDNILIATTNAATAAYYCESATNGVINIPYAYRASVAFVPYVTLPPLPAPSTYPPTTPIGFDDRTIPPATPVILSIDAAMGSDPFVSRFRNCSNVVVGIALVGYIPAEFEVASFYVCAKAPNGFSNFSMPNPNLHISKYTLAPTSIIASASTPTTLVITPATTTTNAWFSSNSLCPRAEAQVGSDSYLGSAIDFASGIQTIGTSYIGLVFVCVLDTRKATVDSSVIEYVPVASLLSVGGPTLGAGSATNPIKGIPWCLTRLVPKSLYNLVEGTDSGSPYARYYNTADRRVFIVNGSSSCSSISNALGTPVTQTGSETAQLCLPTAGLANGSYTVCSGTPAGFVATITAQMTVASPTPSAWVAGTNTLTFFPNMPLRSFLFVPSDRACSIANAVSAPFTTNATSYATVSTFTMGGDLPIPAGTYTLCAKVEQDSPSSAWTAVIQSVNIYKQQFFSVGVTTVTTGVATVIPLMGDLNINNLRSALSPSAATTATRSFVMAAADQSAAASVISPCGTLLDTSVYGAVTPSTTANNTVITNEAVFLAPVAGRYVICALTAVNNTMLPVATITVVNPVVTFADSVAACDVLSVTYTSSAIATETTQTTNMFLTSSYCCTPGAAMTNTSTTLAIIPKPAASSSLSQSMRTVSVTDDQLAVFYPQTEFSLCVQNSTFCVGAGYVTFVGSICANPPVSTTNSSNVDFTGGAATGWKIGRDEIPMTLIVIFFCLLLCCLIIIAIICCCRWRRKVTPKDEDPKAFVEEQDIEMSGARNKSVRNGGGGNDTTIAVPMDMGLFICNAPPIGAQVIENDEGRYRAIIAHQEAEERRELEDWCDREEAMARQNETERHIWEAEQREADDLERIRFAREARLSQISALIAEVNIDEETARCAIEENEDTVRINIAEMEREMWRYHMEREGQMLHERLEGSHFQTQSRRRKLREANDRAFQSINEAAQLQYQQQQQLRSPQSGGAIRSISPIRNSQNPFLVVDDGEYSTVGRSTYHVQHDRSASAMSSRAAPMAVSLDNVRPAAVSIPTSPRNTNSISTLLPSTAANGGGGLGSDNPNNTSGGSGSSSVYYAPPIGVAPNSALRVPAADRSRQLSPLRHTHQAPGSTPLNNSRRTDPNRMF